MIRLGFAPLVVFLVLVAIKIVVVLLIVRHNNRKRQAASGAPYGPGTRQPPFPPGYGPYGPSSNPPGAPYAPGGYSSQQPGDPYGTHASPQNPGPSAAGSGWTQPS
jgi:hypothetical protein